MNRLTIARMVEYLQEIELEKCFKPWDDNAHAVSNLMTLFSCYQDEAEEAVKQAKVSTKQPQEAR